MSNTAQDPQIRRGDTYREKARPAAIDGAPIKSATATAIRPFRIEVPQEQLAELRRRLAATRMPSREIVVDRSQGVQLATVQELARYWATVHDWRACEARLNAVERR